MSLGDLSRRAEAEWQRLRAATPARIGLARAGAAIATGDLLAFQRAHAAARDAVHDRLDPVPLSRAIETLGLAVATLHSAAPDRHTYLARPDLGRRLDDDSRVRLGELPRGHDIVFVIADGLAARAVARHAQPVLAAALGEFSRLAWRVGPVGIVAQGRVAIGDEIGFALDASLVAVLIGERPGLSAPDSLGIYLTWAPAPGRSDAERNCLANIRPGGMSYVAAARRLVALAVAARHGQRTGVALKDLAPADSEPNLLTGAGEGT